MNIDTLTIYRGGDFYINDKISIHQPTLGEICDFGENKYFSIIYLVTSIPSDMKSFLFDNGIDYEKFSDFELFILLTKSLSVKDTAIIFGNLDFTNFECGINEENEELVMYDVKNDIIIDRYIYKIIFDYLTKTHGIKKKVELAGNEFTKRFLIDEDREKNNKKEDKQFSSILLPLISAMVNCEGFKYNHAQVWDMKINAFMDSVRRIQKIKDANNTINGVYSGKLDGTKINKKELDWLGELET
ncbi:MAG: hypothetical protein K0R54_5808 [Clostridiaceae bacterium]|jgi:hypothetical protein|nr:hypothetical protein [Clostridiaceae bacterium]MDF2951046.1 hypothetical protein [Anaerocolumna sp.]